MAWPGIEEDELLRGALSAWADQTKELIQQLKRPQLQAEKEQKKYIFYTGWLTRRAQN